MPADVCRLFNNYRRQRLIQEDQISNRPVNRAIGRGNNWRWSCCKKLWVASLALKRSGNNIDNKKAKRKNKLTGGSERAFLNALIDERTSSILRLLKIFARMLVLGAAFKRPYNPKPMNGFATKSNAAIQIIN